MMTRPSAERVRKERVVRQWFLRLAERATLATKSLFCSKFNILAQGPPLHRTATAMTVNPLRHTPATEYKTLTKPNTNDGNAMDVSTTLSLNTHNARDGLHLWAHISYVPCPIPLCTSIPTWRPSSMSKVGRAMRRIGMASLLRLTYSHILSHL